MILFKMVEPGLYETDDKTIKIKRVKSQRAKDAIEILWTISILGYELPFCYDTLRDAKQEAWDYLISKTKEFLHTDD